MTLANSGVALATASAVDAGSGTAQAPRARISGPITGGLFGRPYGTSLVDLKPWGYTETEYSASGTATGGGSQAVIGVVPNPYQPPSPYVIRILVRRPADPARFNGTMLVEWYNVTEGSDFDADWADGYREILRGGYAFVAVSVQQGGINALKRWDPVRYGALTHPGDTYADSIFAQMLAALRYGNGTNPFAGMSVRHIVAMGHSQSGINLHYYVDNIQSALPLADGFLVRGDVISTFDVGKLSTPVLQYQSEAEIDGLAGQGLQQPTYYVQPVAPAHDTGDYRLWQVAGAAHIDKEANDYNLDTEQRDQLSQPVTWDEGAEGTYDGSGSADCPSSLGLGPSDEFPQWYTVDAAIHALNGWVSTGQAPASAPRMAVTSAGAPSRDQYGNAVGGVRNPAVDVPITTYHGDEGCPLVGATKAMSLSAVSQLYPTRNAYVAAVAAAATRAQQNGWLLCYDAADLLARAQTAGPLPPGSGGTRPSGCAAASTANASRVVGLPNTAARRNDGTSGAVIVLAMFLIAGGLLSRHLTRSTTWARAA